MTNSPTPDVPVTDADRAVVRDYHRQPGRKGESSDQQLARLVAERVHAATAAMQGEVQRLKAECDSLRISRHNAVVQCTALEGDLISVRKSTTKTISTMRESLEKAATTLDAIGAERDALKERRDALSASQYQVGCALSDAGYSELESESEGVRRLAAERDALKAERDSYQHFCSLNGMAEMQKERDTLKARVAELEKLARSLPLAIYEHIAHGDDEHKKWLREQTIPFCKQHFALPPAAPNMVAPPVERASVLGEPAEIRLLREVAAGHVNQHTCASRISAAETVRHVDLLRAEHDRLQAALAEREKATAAITRSRDCWERDAKNYRQAYETLVRRLGGLHEQSSGSDERK